MPFDNPIIDDFVSVGGVNRAQAAADFNKYVPISLDGDTTTDFIAGTARNLIYAGKLWKYDAADTTTAHDGVTCIVSSDSKRYKCNAIDGQGKGVYSLVSFLTAPPASPTAGAIYGCNVAPTGAWAGKGNNLAVALVGGGSPIWGFVPPTSGLIAFDQSQTIFRTYNGSAWADGFGILNSPGSIAPEALIIASFAIQSQTATPPGAPSLNQYWAVGAGATGAWVGKDQQIAKATGISPSVWTFYPASAGWEAWNIATSHLMIFSGGVWADVARPRIVAYPTRIVRTSSAAASGAIVGFSAAAPTNASGALVLPEGSANIPIYTLQKATNRLVIKLRIDADQAAAMTVAVFKDAQVSCDPGMWQNFPLGASGQISHNVEFEVSPGDLIAHTYNVRVYGPGVFRAELQFIEIET